MSSCICLVSCGDCSFPLITIFANAISIICACYFPFRYGLHYHTFQQYGAYFETFDLISGLVKSIVFGFIITSFACYFGDRSYGGQRA
jgi:phospholipid/cholesterol/gamma-HCH transport system permease protein